MGSAKHYLLQALLVSILGTGINSSAGFFEDLKTTQQKSNQKVNWQHFGPGMSGYIDKFWIHNTDSNSFYNQLDMGDIQGTWDHGNKWKTMRDTDGNGGLMGGMKCVAFSHQNADFGLALAKDGIHKTMNRGRSWEFVVDTDTTNSKMHNILSVDPSNDNNWYIGAGQGSMIKNSHFTKDGITYTPLGNTALGFILKSDDKGKSWTKVIPEPNEWEHQYDKDGEIINDSDGNPKKFYLADFSNIIVDPRNSNTVYASCQYGVYRSTDAGLNWIKAAGSNLRHNMPRDMDSFYKPATGDNPAEFYLYIVEVTHYTENPVTGNLDTTGGVFRSADGGETWDDITGNLAIDLTKINSKGYKGRFYNAIAKWFKTDSDSIEAKYKNNLPTSTFSQFIGIEVDPRNKDRVYLVHNFKHDYAFPPGNIWMTENGGQNWIAAAREGLYWENEVDKEYWLSRNNPLGVNTRFAHVQKEHSEKDDTQTGPRFIEVASNGEAYTAFSQQVMRSSDNGTTWSQIDDFETYPGSGHWVGRGDSNLPGQSICVDTGFDTDGKPMPYLFGSGEHGLWRLTDDGDLVYPGAIAVEQISGQSNSSHDALSIDSIAVHPDNPEIIYTLNFRQHRRGMLAKYNKSDGSWDEISETLHFPHSLDVIRQKTLLIDPVNPNNFYFTVPRTEEVPYNRKNGIPNIAESAPSDYSFHGIYKSTTAGVKISDTNQGWVRSDEGIPNDVNIAKIVMDPANPQILYAVITRSHDGKPGGLYKSIDGAALWTKVTIPDNIISVNHLQINKTTGHIYIACGTNTNDTDIGGVWVDRKDDNGWQLIFDNPHIIEVDSSAIDPNVIVVNVLTSSEGGNKNPGAYITIDGAVTWHKINKNLSQPERITRLVIDPNNPKILWGAQYGTGFWRADTSGLYADSDPGEGPFTVTFNPTPRGSISNNKNQIIELGGYAKPPIVSSTAGYEFTGWDKQFDYINKDLIVTAQYKRVLPVTTNLYRWLDADTGVFADGHGNVTGWKEQVSGTLLFPENPDGKEEKPTVAGRGRDRRSAVRFSEYSYFNLDNPDKADGPITVFIAYNRDQEQITSSTWQRAFSIYDSETNTDSNGVGLSLNTGEINTVISPTIYKARSTNKRFSAMSLGINRKNYGRGFSGDISEVIIYDRKLEDDEYAAVEKYLESKWTKYTVTFSPGLFGAIPDDEAVQEIAYESAAQEPSVTPNQGYLHTGWDKSFDSITKATTVTATYEPKKYTVTFLPGAHGTIISGEASQTISYDSSATEPAIKPKIGYTHTGWTDSFDNIHADTQITATYEISTFKVIFDAGSHGAITSGDSGQTIEYEQPAVAPSITPETGYDFTHWDVDYDSITSDITVTAKYSLKSYIVTFNAGLNGTIDPSDVSQSVLHGEAAQSPAVTSTENYAFAGWNKQLSPITGPVTFTAEYALRPFASSSPYIWFSADAGVEVDDAENVIHWTNLVDGKPHSPQGSGTLQLSTRPSNNTPAVKFNGKYFNLDSPGKNNAPVTLFIAYGREDNYSGIINYERAFSSLDTATVNGEVKTNDNVGNGFALSSEKVSGTIPTQIFTHADDLGRFEEMTLGIHRSSLARPFHGEISEVLLYDRQLTESETTAVNDYLTAKWITGTGASLNKVSLNEGYNLTFFPIITADATPEEMLKPIIADLTSVRDLTGNTFNKDGAGWSNTGLTALEAFKPYLIKAKAKTSLTIRGSFPEIPDRLELVEGINLIPVIGSGEIAPLTYFDSIKDDIVYIRDAEGNTMRKVNDKWISTIGNLVAGKSYVVKTTKALTLTFP